VIAIAPYLGDDDLLDKIDRVGGLAHWAPPKGAGGDYQVELWHWLKECTQGRARCPRIFLGFGSEDRFVHGHRILAAALPPSRVVIVPGGHTWEPWRQLLAALLPKVRAERTEVERASKTPAGR